MSGAQAGSWWNGETRGNLTCVDSSWRQMIDGGYSLDSTKQVAGNANSVKITTKKSPNGGTHTYGFSFTASQSVESYTALKTAGYTHVSYYFQYENVSSLYCGLKVIVNNLTTEEVDWIINDNVLGKVTKTAAANTKLWEGASDSSTAVIHSSTDWCEIRVPIDTFIASIGDTGACKVMLTSDYTAVYTFYFGGAQAIKVA